MVRLSQMTWNGSTRRSACLEAAGQFLLRKMELSLCLSMACGKGLPSGKWAVLLAIKFIADRHAMATSGRKEMVCFGFAFQRKQTKLPST
jgi:hypothetical protein